MQSTKYVSWNPHSQHAGFWSATHDPPRRLCYRPGVFFRHSRLNALSFAQIKIMRVVSQTWWFQFLSSSNLHVSEIALTSNCVSLVRPVIANCRFESHQRQRLSRLTFFAFFPVSPAKSWDKALKSGHDRLLVHPLKFITIIPPFQTVWCWITDSVVKYTTNITNTTLKNSDSIFQEASTVFWTLSNVLGLFIPQRSEN